VRPLPRHSSLATVLEVNVNQAPEGIRVEIYDQSYFMRGDLDPEYIRQLAQFVDGKMRAVADRTHIVDSLRVAVLTALNIADECHQLRSKVAKVEKRMAECGDVLDRLFEVA
jgi:cell division protein ZapA (FtsZ GTPase activity inhibitor)